MKSLSLFFLFNNLLLVVYSLPYLVLSSRSQKCLGIDPPRKTTITVTYHFPDIAVEPDEVVGGDTGGESLSEIESRNYKNKMQQMMKTVSVNRVLFVHYNA